MQENKLKYCDCNLFVQKWFTFSAVMFTWTFSSLLTCMKLACIIKSMSQRKSFDRRAHLSITSPLEQKTVSLRILFYKLKKKKVQLNCDIIACFTRVYQIILEYDYDGLGHCAHWKHVEFFLHFNLLIVLDDRLEAFLIIETNIY